jgi:hypothetical protein
VREREREKVQVPLQFKMTTAKKEEEAGSFKYKIKTAAVDEMRNSKNTIEMRKGTGRKKLEIFLNLIDT